MFVKTIFEVTVWNVIYLGLEDFLLICNTLIESRKNKLPPTKIRQKFTPSVTFVNFNEIGCKQCNENDHMDSIFVTFK